MVVFSRILDSRLPCRCFFPPFLSIIIHSFFIVFIIIIFRHYWAIILKVTKLESELRRRKMTCSKWLHLETETKAVRHNNLLIVFLFTPNEMLRPGWATEHYVERQLRLNLIFHASKILRIVTNMYFYSWYFYSDFFSQINYILMVKWAWLSCAGNGNMQNKNG